MLFSILCAKAFVNTPIPMCAHFILVALMLSLLDIKLSCVLQWEKAHVKGVKG